MVLICANHAEWSAAMRICLPGLVICLVLAGLVLAWEWPGRRAVEKGFGNGDNDYFIALTIFSLLLAVANDCFWG